MLLHHPPNLTELFEMQARTLPTLKTKHIIAHNDEDTEYSQEHLRIWLLQDDERSRVRWLCVKLNRKCEYFILWTSRITIPSFISLADDTRISSMKYSGPVHYTESSTEDGGNRKYTQTHPHPRAQSKSHRNGFKFGLGRNKGSRMKYKTHWWSIWVSIIAQ